MLAKECVRPFSHRGSNRSCSKQDAWSIFPFNGLNVATYIGGISKPKLLGSGAPTSFTHQPNRAIADEAPDICRVCYDLTPKPVGSVEWE